MKRWFITGMVFLTLFGGAGVVFGGTALAREANGHASCLGIEASAVSPPGSSEEEPGGMAQLSGELRGLAHELGVPPGALFSGFARLHEGSHEACDEAVE